MSGVGAFGCTEVHNLFRFHRNRMGEMWYPKIGKSGVPVTAVRQLYVRLHIVLSSATQCADRGSVTVTASDYHSGYPSFIFSPIFITMILKICTPLTDIFELPPEPKVLSAQLFWETAFSSVPHGQNGLRHHGLMVYHHLANGITG